MKNPGKILELHNIYPMIFIFQVVYNEFLTSCYVRYSANFFLVYLPVSRIKICKILQCTFCTYLKIIAFSKRDGLKMNGSSIG